MKFEKEGPVPLTLDGISTISKEHTHAQHKAAILTFLKNDPKNGTASIFNFFYLET